MGGGFGMGQLGRIGSGAAFDPSSLFAAAESGGWWDPSDLSTLFQTNDTSTPVTAAGQSVGRVSDKSGNGFHLTQATAGNRPTYQVDSNGKPYLLFDGVDDFLTAAFTLAFPFDRISAIRQVAWTIGKRIFTFGGGTLLNQRTATPQININDGVSDIVKTGSLAVGSNGVVTERHISGAQQIAVNNGAYTSGNAGATAPSGNFAVGADSAGNNASSIRLYGAIIRAGTMTDEQVADTREWLAGRAGVAL